MRQAMRAPLLLRTSRDRSDERPPSPGAPSEVDAIVAVVPHPTRSYIAYVDDSGNENLGLLWLALLIPLDLWTEYLGRWLGFRKNLYAKTHVPASHEIHAQVWLSPDPLQETDGEALGALRDDAGELPGILLGGKASRRERSRWYEKGLLTIGTFTEARLLTVFSYEHSGPAKIALYDELLCFIEEFLRPEKSHATMIVDGAMDSGSHLRTAHRALLIQRRRIVEDATLRRSSESQLLQMTDICAYAAFQSLQGKRNAVFASRYEDLLGRLIQRPFGVETGRCIRGFDYSATIANCPSERIAARP